MDGTLPGFFQKIAEDPAYLKDYVVPVITIILTIIGIIVAARQFTLARKQYSRNLRWKESEFLANKTSDFFNDEINSAALSILDWTKRTIVFSKQGEKVKITVDRPLLMVSLSNNPMTFTVDQMHIRDMFDHFFTELEVFHKFIQAGLVKKEEVFSYFKYWLNVLAGKNLQTLDEATLMVIYQFLKKYNYVDACALLELYDNKLDIDKKIRIYVGRSDYEDGTPTGDRNR
jgi:hypothetical protein